MNPITYLEVTPHGPVFSQLPDKTGVPNQDMYWGQPRLNGRHTRFPLIWKEPPEEAYQRIHLIWKESKQLYLLVCWAWADNDVMYTILRGPSPQLMSSLGSTGTPNWAQHEQERCHSEAKTRWDRLLNDDLV